MLLDFKNIAIEFLLFASSLRLTTFMAAAPFSWDAAAAGLHICAMDLSDSSVVSCCSTSAFKNKLTNLILRYQLSISTAGAD